MIGMVRLRKGCTVCTVHNTQSQAFEPIQAIHTKKKIDTLLDDGCQNRFYGGYRAHHRGHNALECYKKCKWEWNATTTYTYTF
jgi:hypothetical protein